MRVVDSSQNVSKCKNSISLLHIKSHSVWDPQLMGAASGGVIAPEPPRATRSEPEFIRIVVYLFCFFLSFFFLQAQYQCT